jgi:hypothetical protein
LQEKEKVKILLDAGLACDDICVTAAALAEMKIDTPSIILKT